MRPTVMLQAVIQRIFFSNFAQLESADSELHHHQKYLKVIANQLKIGIGDLQLIFHEDSSIFMNNTNLKCTETKIRRTIFSIFMKQSVLEYSIQNRKKVLNLLTKVRKDKQLKLISESILIGNEIYSLFSQNMFRKCIDLFEKWQKINIQKEYSIQISYVLSKIYTGLVMLKMRIDDLTNIDCWFEKSFSFREKVYDQNFTINKMTYLKKTIYLKLKFVQILIQKQQYDKAYSKFKKYQTIFSKDQQGHNYLKNVLMSRISNMKKVIGQRIIQQAINFNKQNDQIITVLPTPRQKSKSVQIYKIRSRSKKQSVQKKEVYVDLNNPFYRMKRVKSNNQIQKHQIESVYKNIRQLRDKKLVSTDITNQLNKIRQSIINRGTVQPQIIKKRATSRMTSKSKSSIFQSRGDSRLAKLKQIPIVPSFNTIRFLHFDYDTPILCLIQLDEDDKNQILTINFQGCQMKKQFLKNEDYDEFDSQWSALKYLFRRYLRGDQIFRQIDKYTKIPNQDVNQQIVSTYYKCRLQNQDIVQVVQLKQLIKTFISFNYFRIKQSNGFKPTFVRKYNWDNITTKLFLKQELRKKQNIERVIVKTPKFNQLFAKFPPRIMGLQFTISRQYQIYRIIVYFKRHFFENYINLLTDEPLKQTTLEVDIKIMMPKRNVNPNSKMFKSEFREYKGIQIPLELFYNNRCIQSHQISKYLLDILINNFYQKHLTKYFLDFFVKRASISYEQQLILELQDRKRTFEYQFDRIPMHKYEGNKTKITITQIQQPCLIRIQKRRHLNSYLVRKLSSMSAQQQMQSLRDSCDYLQRKLCKCFNGKIHIVQIRILKQKKRVNRQWLWVAHYYVTHINNKISHKFSVNSNDEKILNLDKQCLEQISLQQKAIKLSNHLVFANRGPYRSLCLKYNSDSYIYSNSLNYLKLKKHRFGAVSRYELCRACQFSKIIKINKKFLVLSVYKIHWSKQIYWQVEFSLNNGQIWVCTLTINEIMRLQDVQQGQQNNQPLFTNTRNQWYVFWNNMFNDKINLNFDKTTKSNYLSIRGVSFKIQQRLAVISTQTNDIRRHIDVKIISSYQFLQNTYNCNNFNFDSQFKIIIFQDGHYYELQISYKQLEVIFKFQNNGQVLSNSKKSYKILVDFINEKLPLFMIKARQQSYN